MINEHYFNENFWAFIYCLSTDSKLYLTTDGLILFKLVNYNGMLKNQKSICKSLNLTPSMVSKRIKKLCITKVIESKKVGLEKQISYSNAMVGKGLLIARRIIKTDEDYEK
jgi:DNA-binding Lrp family transcriptional regulator